MTWREAIRQVRPADGDLISDEVARQWRGARIYMSLRSARLEHLGTGPHGAADQFALDIHAAVLRRGGTTKQARTILLALVGRKFDIA